MSLLPNPNGPPKTSMSLRCRLIIAADAVVNSPLVQQVVPPCLLVTGVAMGIACCALRPVWHGLIAGLLVGLGLFVVIALVALMIEGGGWLSEWLHQQAHWCRYPLSRPRTPKEGDPQ